MSLGRRRAAGPSRRATRTLPPMRYAVVERLGRGGMGVVDLATDDEGRRVALKRMSLHGSSAAMADARRRIRREADVLASLDHPGIVPLIEVLDEGDDLVLVMPYLEGGSLSDAVAAAGPLPPARVLEIAGRLLPALAAAHRQGVVHRDIKPSNVLLGADGAPVIADFGVAVTRDGTDGLTAYGVVLGTPAFMAPEQARGETAGPPADVFALGATLRWALTGVGPYGEGNADVLARRAAAGKVVPLPRELPTELRRLLRSMLTEDPAKRPSAAALAGGPEGTAMRTLAVPRPRRVPRRSTLKLVGGALAVAAVIATTAIGVAVLTADEAAAPVDAPVAPACTDLPYQPCGQEPAPGTDGQQCLAGRDDYDGDATTGCEAVADDVPELTLIERGTEVTANLVPADDTDSWTYEADDRFQLLCDGTITVTFAAAPGVAQQLEVLDGDEVVATTSSADSTPMTLRLVEPQCAGGDATTLTLVVSSIGRDRSAEPYTLDVDGSY